MIDALRGEVFAAAYPRTGELPPYVALTRALSPDELQGAVVALARAGGGGGPWLAVGDGALRYRDRLTAAGARIPADSSPLHRVDGAAICELGALAAAACSYEQVLPDYRRPPDARLVAADPARAAAAQPGGSVQGVRL